MNDRVEYVVPKGYYYTRDHEWFQLKPGETALVGITDYAAKMLHDIVYVSLPESGSFFEARQVFGQVESVKTVSDVYMPVSGTVIRTNSRLTKEPEVISTSPYSDGWMLEVKAANYEKESPLLLNSDQYFKFIMELKESDS
jgi:glycine cleavage system H protein